MERARRFTRGDVLGGYTLVSQLGSGRFSNVWTATKGPDQAEVALKIYKTGSGDISYFENELAVLGRIPAAPCIVGHREAFKHVDGRETTHPCIVFDLADDTLGGLLKDHVREHDRGLPMDTVKQIMRGVLTGLAYLHSRGIVHTDIKPDNILLSSDLDVIIGDLGSSTTAENIFSDHIGTAQYLSPEALLELPYSYPHDIWAAFVMCFELITGDLLFDLYAECDIIYGIDCDGYFGDGSCTDSNSASSANDSSAGTSSATDSASSTASDASSDSDISTGTMAETGYKHMLLMRKLLGPPPRKLIKKAGLYHNSRGLLKNDPYLEQSCLAELLYNNYDLSMDECRQIEEFLLAGLRYMPADRITAEAALAHPFLL